MYARRRPYGQRPARAPSPNGYSVIWGILYVVMMGGILGALGWLIGITVAYSNNNKEINTLQKDLKALTLIVNEQEEFINNVTENPPAIFRTVCYEEVDITVSDTFRNLTDPGLGPLCSQTSADYDQVYDNATGCFTGTGLELDDTFFINARLTGDTTPLFVGTMQAIYCNGTEIPYQGQRGDIQFATNDTVTITEEFFFTVTEDLLDGGGVLLRAMTFDPSYHINITSIYYVVFRYRPLSDPFLIF